MTNLVFSIEWPYGSYPINRQTEPVLVETIRDTLLGHQLTPESVGQYIQNLLLKVGDINTPFDARLESMSPPIPALVSETTEIQITQLGTHGGAEPRGRNDMTDSGDDQLERLIMFKRTFNPRGEEAYYKDLFASLVGIPKDVILADVMSLLMPAEVKASWSMQHYQRVVPILRLSTHKAPVILLGGAPGTGKTALATSIGAMLAESMNECVAFKHMSLTVRGMGYQGRASSIVSRLFDYMTEEYKRVRHPILLFFDEADAVVGSRTDTDASSGAQENIALVNAIIVGLDNLRKSQYARVVALFATNLTSRIDPALVRRSYYYVFERPDTPARSQIFKNCLDEMGFNAGDIDTLVRHTEPRQVGSAVVPFTASDIVELIVGRAVNDAIRTKKRLDLDMLLRYCQDTLPTGYLSERA